MSRKTKRPLLVPAILLIYAGVMAYISYPRYKESGDWNEYLTVTGISLAIVILLYFLLKRRQKIRDNFTRKD